MEAVEDTYVEAAILWLAQTILASLLAGKLEAWLRQVGLADDTEKLRYEIERVETVVSAGKGRLTGNKPLARSLGRLKELMYDADDVVDELDYYRLKHQVEGDPTACATEPESTDGHGAEQADGSRYNPDTMSSSGVKKRSKAWGEFRVTEDADGKPVKAECIHCHTVVRCETSKGTSVLHNHLKSDSCKRKRAAIEQTPNPSAGDGAQNGATVSIHDSDSRKRKRIDEASAHNTAANKNPWNKAEFCNRIEQTTNQLKEAISEVQKLYGSDSVASTNVCKNTAADPRRRTSSLVQRKMYGRLAEKDSIMKLMTEDKSESVLVLPIVGIGGIGKTALAQHIYNDPTVKSQFDHRIWAWVSNNVDEVRLTREMLDFVSKEKHEGISSLAKLQEILESHVTSNRFLLILDDVWGNMDEHTWNKLLAPLKSDNAKGNVIIVTTRQLSIAKRICTVEPIKLGGLQDDDFWLLIRACAFGDDKYEGHPSLNIIRRQIAEKLQGNPLAAETAGMLLREHLTIDHWSNILKNENWKSLKLNGGIMPALKLSYDYLPDHLQHCFRYCCLFPKDHHFCGAELVRIWISQGFVDSGNTSKSLEDTGNSYLADLMDSSLFEQVKCKRYSQECFVMHGLMHDLAWKVSRAEFGTIDGWDSEEILPTVRHLSIVTDSACINKKLRRIKSMRQLRSLLLIVDHYDPSFLEEFQNMFKEAGNLRLLQISATNAEFVSFLRSLVNCSHLRYLKLKNEFIGEDILPISLSKFYNLEVLDAGHPTIVHGMNDLVSTRYLVVTKGARSSVTSVGEMNNHQDVPNFTDQNSSCSEITQLQSMNKLVQLDVFQLENVSSAEAYGAKLRDKQHLKKVHFSWKVTLSHDGYASDTSFEPSGDTESEEENLAMYDAGPDSEPFIDIETEENSWPMDDINNDQSSEHFVDTAREVLEGLEPHHNLKHLQISGYSGATSPAWLATSVRCLQTLHLEDCGEWEKLPSLGRLSFLTKLKLRKMQKVIEVSIPSLEELVLIEMPKLERCSCNSVRDLNSSLRVLNIQRCHLLKAFPLFESCEKHKIEKKSLLSCLSELTIHDCPYLTVAYPLPPSNAIVQLSIRGVPKLPKMEGSSRETLIIGSLDKLDHNVLAFHNLAFLSHLILEGCRNLSFTISEGFRQFINLKRLAIYRRKMFNSHDFPEDTDEDMAFTVPPSLKHLTIVGCKIKWSWLSWMLQQVQALEELHLAFCHLRGLLLEKEESSLPNLISSPEASSSGNPYDASTSSASNGLLCVPSNIISSLKNMTISNCGDPTFYGSKDGFVRFTSLEELSIWGCPKLISSLVCKAENNDHASERWLLPDSLCKLAILLGIIHSLEIPHSPETLQLCFPGNMTRLKKLTVCNSPRLKCLQLDSCTALEELDISRCNSLTALEGLDFCTALEKMKIESCESLTAVEGLQSLGGLRSLALFRCPGLPPCLEHLSRQGYELCPRLETLQIDDYSFLTKSFCKQLTSLQLTAVTSEVTKLTDEQERALQLLASLQELQFHCCYKLADLPAGLHSLASLKRLKIVNGRKIARLPQMGLPPTLEELDVNWCSDELSEQCRMLASKLKVKIDGKYVH
ncbi:putative disease resistance protein RGA4 [Phragmites australis]|uniref:putative disease resistance protein RGA4 n=1 Tax=Phragmites australis TaxID=29695 RepID=UPI002D799098|nr:putative disease resistance protein RGA4 [Phragmites australis]